MALTQRALAEALTFAEGRTAFGKPIIEHPLLHRQFEEKSAELRAAFALAWEALTLLNEVWRETPKYSDHRQILDGLEVMECKAAHRMLFQHLAPFAHPQELEEMIATLDAHLALPPEEKEGGAEKVFRNLAVFTANTLLNANQK